MARGGSIAPSCSFFEGEEGALHEELYGNDGLMIVEHRLSEGTSILKRRLSTPFMLQYFLKTRVLGEVMDARIEYFFPIVIPFSKVWYIGLVA